MPKHGEWIRLRLVPQIDSDVIVGTKRHRAAFVPSNEVSFHVVDVSVIEEDLSTHIAKGSVPLSYHSIPADQLFDPLLGWKKSNIVPVDNPNFDDHGARAKWVAGVKKNAALLNPSPG